MLKPSPRRLAIVLILLVGSLLPGPARAQTADLHVFGDYGYDDLTARGMFGTINYFFPVPPGQVAEAGSQIELVFSHSPLLLPERSTMTVVVNGESLTSLFLNKRNAARARLSLPLPLPPSGSRSRPSGYSIQLRFYLRLAEDECEAPNNSALWATVHADSTIRLATAWATQPPALDAAASLFTPAGPESRPATLVVPPNPRPEELAAAGLVAFGVGRWASSAHTDPRLSVATSPPAQGPAILVGSGNALVNGNRWAPLEWDGEAYTLGDEVVAGAHGILAIRQQDGPQLLVTGATPPAVQLAAEALVRPELHALLGGSHAVFTGREPVRPIESSAWENGTASFAQLGEVERRVEGPGQHRVEYSFERPPGWNVADEGVLDLAIARAPSLDAGTSWVAVAINGQEIGALPLDRPADSNDPRYRFAVPRGLLQEGAPGRPHHGLTVELRLFLDVLHEECAPIPAGSAWATILPSSQWSLPHDSDDSLALEHFPAPLLGESAAPLTVVIPVRPAPSEIATGLVVMAALGRWSVVHPTLLPRLASANTLDPPDLAESHLILVMSRDRTSPDTEIGRQGQALFVAIDPVAYRLPRDEAYGLLRLVRSPWSRDRAVLVVTGDGERAVELAANALGNGAQLAQLSGQTVAIIEGLPAQTLEGGEPGAGDSLSGSPRVVPAPARSRLQPSTFLGAATVGIGLSLLLLLLIRVRRGLLAPGSRAAFTSAPPEQ